jgi:hypothetical protein
MGSGLYSSDMPEIKRQAFVEAFSKLRQRIIWKWETDSLPGKPSNVKIGKWFPQSDILGKLQFFNDNIFHVQKNFIFCSIYTFY